MRQFCFASHARYPPSFAYLVISHTMGDTLARCDNSKSLASPRRRSERRGLTGRGADVKGDHMSAAAKTYTDFFVHRSSINFSGPSLTS